MEQIGPGIWTLRFPLKMLGMDLGRTVTVIRLRNGKLVIHSTAAFTTRQTNIIRNLGEPAWLVEAMLRHDTFTIQGRRAFPQAVFLAPPGFPTMPGYQTRDLTSPPAEWLGDLDVAPINGAPDFGEFVLLHPPSRTLIVADLLVNFDGPQRALTKLLLRAGCAGGRYAPGFTRPFKRAIKDSAAFRASIDKVLEWDFDRIVVGHGNTIRSGGKALLVEALRSAGVL